MRVIKCEYPIVVHPNQHLNLSMLASFLALLLDNRSSGAGCDGRVEVEMVLDEFG